MTLRAFDFALVSFDGQPAGQAGFRVMHLQVLLYRPRPSYSSSSSQKQSGPPYYSALRQVQAPAEKRLIKRS